MKKFAFVSDFDGTLTERDFYHIVIDKFLGDEGRKMYIDQKKNGKIDVPFLNSIFGKIGLSEEELKEEIYKLPLDPHAEDFINKVRAYGGEFYIISAGTSYYIDILFEHLGIKNVNIISMKGRYSGGGFEILPDREGRYYSDVFGIDKGRFIQDLKMEYSKVYFAGDSEPDFNAAKAADMCFAKGELIALLESDNREYTAVKDYSQIDDYLTEKGVFA